MKSILISCGARLAPFDIQELRDITAYDELELDTLGDRKTALLLIMSDTDATFNFLLSMIHTQFFNLLCEKTDDVYGGKLLDEYTGSESRIALKNVEAKANVAQGNPVHSDRYLFRCFFSGGQTCSIEIQVCLLVLAPVMDAV